MASVCSFLEVLLGIWMAEADRSRGVYIEHEASQPARQKSGKGIYIDDVRGPGRCDMYAWRRHIYMYICYVR
jgi:hypothetical protein